jgi:hypothetical protein
VTLKKLLEITKPDEFNFIFNVPGLKPPPLGGQL